MASILRRGELPLIVVIVAMLSTFVEYYSNLSVVPGATTFATSISTYATIIAAFGTCMAAVEAIRHHGTNVFKRTKGRWIYSIATLTSLAIVIIVGLLFKSTSAQYLWLYRATITPESWAFTGIIIFYVSSACWRVFKMRSIDSTLLLLTAVLVCLSNAPLATLLWPGFSSIRSWLDTYVSSSVGMAFNMGAAIGGIVFGIRVFLGLERRYNA